MSGARYAASGHNAQSTEFVVVQEKESLKKISEFTQSFLSKILKQLRNPLIKNMLLILAKYEIEGVLQMSDFDRIIDEFKNSIHHLLSIPNKNQVYGALAIGYPKFKYKKWIERRPARIYWKSFER